VRDCLAVSDAIGFGSAAADCVHVSADSCPLSNASIMLHTTVAAAAMSNPTIASSFT
jgi:hypothetical protein